MHAYGEDYLELAQKNLGNMLDYAVNSLQYDLNRFYDMFLVSGLSKQFENGNPKYIAGMTGCELAKEVLCEIGQIVGISSKNVSVKLVRIREELKNMNN